VLCSHIEKVFGGQSSQGKTISSERTEPNWAALEDYQQRVDERRKKK